MSNDRLPDLPPMEDALNALARAKEEVRKSALLRLRQRALSDAFVSAIIVSIADKERSKG